MKNEVLVLVDLAYLYLRQNAELKGMVTKEVIHYWEWITQLTG